MSVFREIPVTAGFPLKARDIISSFDAKNRPDALEEDFKAYLGTPYARVVYSGTTSLYIILEAIKNLTAKRTVIIPSYTCPLVPLAIKRAGFNIEICDIQGRDFNYNLGELDIISSGNNDIAAILAVHLAGIPVDFDSIERIAKRNSFFIIEDCALSLGASYKDRKTGSLGDFSFFSLCRGKGVTMYEGGIIVTTRPGYVNLLDETIKEKVRSDPVSEGIKILELFGYGIFYRPLTFWFAYKLPEVFWNAVGRPFKAGGEEYNLDFPTHRVSGLRKKIGRSMFLRLDEETEKQRKKASYYIGRLKNIRGLTVITEPVYAKANYPYVTILFNDPAEAVKIRKRFFGLGLGASDIYSLPINEYVFLKDMLPAKIYPNARRIAGSNLTLSTSDFIGRKDMDRLLDCLSKRDEDYPA